MNETNSCIASATPSPLRFGKATLLVYHAQETFALGLPCKFCIGNSSVIQPAPSRALILNTVKTPHKKDVAEEIDLSSSDIFFIILCFVSCRRYDSISRSPFHFKPRAYPDGTECYAYRRKAFLDLETTVIPYGYSVAFFTQKTALNWFT